jgi:hypothetical protein
MVFMMTQTNTTKERLTSRTPLPAETSSRRYRAIDLLWMAGAPPYSSAIEAEVRRSLYLLGYVLSVDPEGRFQATNFVGNPEMDPPAVTR